MTPDEQKALEYFELMEELLTTKEAFLEGWKAAMKYAELRREQWELSSHRRE